MNMIDPKRSHISATVSSVQTVDLVYMLGAGGDVEVDRDSDL